MKKNILLFFLFAIISCSSDDSSNSKEVAPNPSTVEWIPGQISLMNGSMSVFTDSYPHAEGCDKDFIRIVNNNSAILFEHEPGSCNVTETAQPWSRNGNQISLVIYETTITGTILTETSSQLIIESDASQYTPLIMILYPQLADYIDLLEGMKVHLVLDKK